MRSHSVNQLVGKLGALLSVGLLCAACATGTTYKPMNEGGRIHGYEETRQTDGNFHLRYVGNIEEKQSVVYDLFMRRAADLAVQNGAKYFKVAGGAFGQYQAPYGTMNRTMPQYEGTVILLQEKQKDALGANETLAKYTAVKK